MTAVRYLSLAALLPAALSAATVAQVPPPATAKPAPRVLKVPGVSPAGNAILTRLDAQSVPVLLPLARQQKVLRDQLQAVLAAPAVDIDKFAALLRQGEALQGQLRTRQNDRVIAALRALPEADRAPFLRAMTAAQGAKPAAPAQ